MGKYEDKREELDRGLQEHHERMNKISEDMQKINQQKVPRLQEWRDLVGKVEEERAHVEKLEALRNEIDRL